MSNSYFASLQGVNQHVSQLVSSVGIDQAYIADMVLPVVPVNAPEFTYRTMANDALASVSGVDTLRASGAMPNRVDVRFSTASGILGEHMLSADVDIQELAAAGANGNDPNMIVRAKLSAAKSGVLIGKEAAVAAVVFGSGNYGSNTSSDVDFGATGLRKILHAKMSAVVKLTGRRPNVLVLGDTSETELINNADFLDVFKYTGGSPSLEAIAAYMGLEKILVGRACTQAAAAAGAAGTGTYIWTHDSAALIYAPSGVTEFDPSFGWLFQGQYAFGREFAKTIAKNELIETWGYGQHYLPKASGMTAGWLFTNTDQ